MKNAVITGWGKCLPPAILTNADLATFLDTSDEWISSRSGIRERRILHTNLSDMAAVAADHAIACAGLQASDIEMIILDTASPDTLIPSAASRLQLLLGANNAAVMDINAACTGFLYGLSLARSLVRSGDYQKVLVIGADRLTWLIESGQSSACQGIVVGSKPECVGVAVKHHMTHRASPAGDRILADIAGGF